MTLALDFINQFMLEISNIMLFNYNMYMSFLIDYSLNGKL